MPPRRGIRISLTALPTSYKGIRTQAMLNDLTKFNERSIKEYMNWIKKYPPQDTLPGEEGGRKRTYVLLRSWRYKNTSTAAKISFTIENFARETDRPRGKYYARIVHGPGVGSPSGQSSFRPDMAALGWRNVNDAFTERGPGSRAEFRANAQYYVNKHTR